MANKYMKRCSSFFFREMQIKLTMSYHYILIRMIRIKKNDYTQCCKKCGATETLKYFW